jgi:hypothetical protein
MELHKALQKKGTARTDSGRRRRPSLAEGAGAAYSRRARECSANEIFTPPVAAMLRSAMNPELRGAMAAGTRASIRDDAPRWFALHVNGVYPEGAARSTVPGNVLKILPLLPDGLEYRIVDNHLILLDVDVAVVLDYLFNVMCARC